MNVRLYKISEFAPWETETLERSCGGVRPNALPLRPLCTHRDGLRRNDLITLASALFIISLHGGTGHRAPIPGTVGPDGKIVPVNF